VTGRAMSRMTAPSGVHASNRDIAPMVCETCERPIAGPVYFARKYGTPLCGDCAVELSWQRYLKACEMLEREPDDREEYVARAGGLPSASRCEVCDREVAWLIWRQVRIVVCSSACDRERRNARRRVAPSEKFCESCGERFVPKRSDARTCSARCRKRLSRMPAREVDHDAVKEDG
jgi:hypothetical protein